MDNLLLDIKNFLKKLETGQLEIEAGQWELHKDLTNVKETVEEMRKLKEDVEEMKLNNVEAMELIKGLENKLEAYKASEPTTVSENSEEYEEIYQVPKENKNNSKGFKKRKCHRIVSEKIIEITSDIDSTHTKKQELSESESFPEETEVNGCTTENEETKPYREQKTRALSDQTFLKKKRRTRKPDGVIMERYLKDAAKYRNRGSSSSLEHKKDGIVESICTTTTRADPEHSIYWNEEKKSKSQQKNRAMKSLEKVTHKESILPKQFFCSKCPRGFAFKSEFSRHQKYAHEKPKFYCRTCKKFFDKKCRLKDHVSLYIMEVKNKHSKGGAYKCSYCNKTSFSPEQLTAHLKRCRIISKANFKRK